MQPFLIEANGLRKSFHSRQARLVHAVDGVDLDIPAGEIYGLVGSDGAGKTTTLRLLVGALEPDAGEAAIAGFDIQQQTEQARAQHRLSLAAFLAVRRPDRAGEHPLLCRSARPDRGPNGSRAAWKSSTLSAWPISRTAVPGSFPAG